MKDSWRQLIIQLIQIGYSVTVKLNYYNYYPIYV